MRAIGNLAGALAVVAVAGMAQQWLADAHAALDAAVAAAYG